MHVCCTCSWSAAGVSVNLGTPQTQIANAVCCALFKVVNAQLLVRFGKISAYLNEWAKIVLHPDHMWIAQHIPVRFLVWIGPEAPLQAQYDPLHITPTLSNPSQKVFCTTCWSKIYSPKCPIQVPCCCVRGLQGPRPPVPLQSSWLHSFCGSWEDTTTGYFLGSVQWCG